MPIFDYKCSQCLDEIEKIHKLNDIVICDKCQIQMERKSIYRFGFQLKGTGWYQTDFKNDS